MRRSARASLRVRACAHAHVLLPVFPSPPQDRVSWMGLEMRPSRQAPGSGDRREPGRTCRPSRLPADRGLAEGTVRPHAAFPPRTRRGDSSPVLADPARPGKISTRKRRDGAETAKRPEQEESPRAEAAPNDTVARPWALAPRPEPEETAPPPGSWTPAAGPEGPAGIPTPTPGSSPLSFLSTKRSPISKGISKYKLFLSHIFYRKDRLWTWRGAGVVGKEPWTAEAVPASLSSPASAARQRSSPLVSSKSSDIR